MLQEAHLTSAPNSLSVSIKTAVWIVIWREPEIRAPFKGFLLAYSLRIAINPGISVSAIAISFLPKLDKLISATR